MTNEEIAKALEGVAPSRQVRFIKSKPQLAEAVNSRFPDLPIDEAAYLYTRGHSSRPVCKNCGGEVSWFGNRYAKTCSRTCDVRSRSEEYRTKNAERLSLLSRQAETKEKSRNTRQKLYGGYASEAHKESARSRADDLNRKGRQTLLSRHGVSNASQVSGSRTKAALTRASNAPTNNHRVDERRRERVSAILPDHLDLLAVIAPRLSEGEANWRYRLSCQNCGSEETMPSETLKFRMRSSKMVCTLCSGITTARSIKENNLADWIESLGVEATRGDRKIIAPYELDIVLPEHGLAIEFCGLFWHSERAGKDRGYHKMKMERCEASGYRLLTVFEDEWDQRPEVVKSVIRAALGLSGTRIAARKCSVCAITSREANRFFGQNHLMGSGRANVFYGLFHETQLVAAMSFSKHDLSRRSVGWDMNRFCVAKDHSVVGAASKLFKAFVREHSPDKVVSYADLRYGRGNVYANLGFVYEKSTVPNYWYTKGETRRHRFGLRKTADHPKDVTEREIRSAEGWTRIWDCGHAKWVWVA